MSQVDMVTSAPPLKSSSGGSSGSSMLRKESASWLADALGVTSVSWYDACDGSNGPLTFLCCLQSAAASAAAIAEKQQQQQRRQWKLSEAATDEEDDQLQQQQQQVEEAKNNKREKSEEDGVNRRAWPTQGCYAAASTAVAAAADPVLSSKVCRGHIDDSDYDSHRVSQYKQRKYLTVSTHRAAAVALPLQQRQQQQQEIPAAAAAAAARGPSPQQQQQQATTHGGVASAARARRQKHHRSSRKATRPSLGYTPTLRRLDEVEPAAAAAASEPERLSPQTSGGGCDDAAGDVESAAQRRKSSTHVDRRDADIGAGANRMTIEASRGKAAVAGRDAASVVQEAERSPQFVWADNDSPIPSRVGRF